MKWGWHRPLNEIQSLSYTSKYECKLHELGIELLADDLVYQTSAIKPFEIVYAITNVAICFNDLIDLIFGVLCPANTKCLIWLRTKKKKDELDADLLHTYIIDQYNPLSQDYKKIRVRILISTA